MKALFLDRDPASRVQSEIRDVALDALPRQGNVLVRVLYSSVNYKDGLAVTGRGKIVRADYPFVPGIDLCGEVVESGASRFAAGDLVVGTGWSIGEAFWGGYAEYQWMDEKWLVPLPETMTPKQAMVMGTAGFTAMLSMLALEKNGIRQGEIVVTGASGGVGSIAVAILSKEGYAVVASTGKETAHKYLSGLGASRIIGRSDLSAGAIRPMDNARWVGCVDTVGGTTLEAVVSQMGKHGGIAACGLAGGHELNTTVFPFILRGVNLLGIDSNTCPAAKRELAWRRLGDMMTATDYETMSTTILLEQVGQACAEITQGNVTGRIVVEIATK